MKLKWPWREFPRDEIAWEECQRQMEKVIWKLKSSLFLGTLTDVEKYRSQVLEFLERVEEPVGLTKTITISEFKNLVIRTKSLDLFGLFAINEKAHKKQCENLKVGDKVFYLEIKNNGIVNRIPQIDVIIMQASVVEDGEKENVKIFDVLDN